MSSRLIQALRDGEEALQCDDHAGAVTAFTRARDAAPDDIGVAIALCHAQRLAGDPLAARAALLQAWHRQAERETGALAAADAHALGAALLEVGAPREASTLFERVRAQHPHDPGALAALASARRAYGDPGAAWPLIQRALQLAPSHPAFLLTAAQIRHDLGDSRGAHRWLDLASAARPDHAPTRLQRAYTSLLQGASADGWSHFEARALPVPANGARAWHGEDLRRASVLVTAEQGVGDQFQFGRFVSLLAAREPSRVIVACHADVVELFRANGMDATARGDTPSTDWHVPMMSLPHRLALGGDAQGDRVPYLRAPAGIMSPLPAREGRPRLGVVWAGNPAFAGAVIRDFDRSLLPRVLNADFDWVSLQQGEAGRVSIDGLRTIAPLRDWRVTAALLASLDGLVTTDTGIAHLAGAMGVPTWVMLQHVPDWRWGLHGESTPWYPAVRLVRQKRAGDWASVLSRLAAQLAAWRESVDQGIAVRADR